MKCKKCRHFYTVMVTKEGYNPFPCCRLREDEETPGASDPGVL